MGHCRRDLATAPDGVVRRRLVIVGRGAVEGSAEQSVRQRIPARRDERSTMNTNPAQDPRPLGRRDRYCTQRSVLRMALGPPRLRTEERRVSRPERSGTDVYWGQAYDVRALGFVATQLQRRRSPVHGEAPWPRVDLPATRVLGWLRDCCTSR